MKSAFYWVLSTFVFGMFACEQAVEPVQSTDSKSSVSAALKPNSTYVPLTRITLSPGKIFTFQYSSDGKLLQSDLSDSLKNVYGVMGGHWTFVYDSAGHLDKVISEDGTGFEVTTDTAGRVIEAVRSAGGMFMFKTTSTYNTQGHLTSFDHVTMGGSRNTYTYTYTAAGNLNTLTRAGSPSALNFSLKATGFDGRTSIWYTNAQSSIIYWWLLSITTFADQSPALFLSYQSNITNATYTDLQGQKTILKLTYDYLNNTPVLIRPLRTADGTAFGGPYAFEYQSFL